MIYQQQIAAEIANIVNKPRLPVEGLRGFKNVPTFGLGLLFNAVELACQHHKGPNAPAAFP